MTGILFPLVAIVAGTLAASTVVIQKLPDAANLIKKIKPYEGFIGAAALLMGLFQVLNITTMLSTGLTGLVGIACLVACAIMGFLLGFPVLQEFFFDEMSEESRKKADDLYAKLTPYKVTAGLTAMGTGVYLLIF